MEVGAVPRAQGALAGEALGVRLKGGGTGSKKSGEEGEARPDSCERPPQRRRFCASLPQKCNHDRTARHALPDRLECVSSDLMAAMTDERSTDFGFQRVAREDKARRVRGVFDSGADHYALMNDLMSAGAPRLWQRFTLALANLRAGQRALDVAGGSGDLAAGLARQVGERGLIVLTDIN